MPEGSSAPEQELNQTSTENAPQKSAKGLRAFIDRAKEIRASRNRGNTDAVLRTALEQSQEETKAQEQRAKVAESNTMVDEKTGLHNDKWLKERIENAIRESQRTGKNFFIAFMDIDDFKIVNSRFDHSGGDKILKSFAQIQTRPGEEIARFGGDEFVQILNDDIQETEAVMVASRNAQFFSKESSNLIPQMPINDSETPKLDEVTISIGLVQYSPGMDFEKLKAESSQMMLNSKNLGRDRISMKSSNGEIKIFDRSGSQITTPPEEPVPVS